MSKPKNIILIEDNEDCRILLKFWLERKKMNFRIHSFGNVTPALEFIKTTCKEKIEDWPDFIFLDLYLPDGYGLNFLKELLLYCTENPRPKIFIITGSEKMEDVRNASGYDIDAYIRKPFTVKRLDKIFAKSYLKKHSEKI
jgi:response regulator of citrate/malate metabolism